MPKHHAFAPLVWNLEARALMSSDVLPAAGIAEFASELRLFANPDPATPQPLNRVSVRVSFRGAWQKADYADLHRSMVQSLEKSRPAVVFYGDSITALWHWEGRQAWQRNLEPLGAANLGIAGDHTQSLLWRLNTGAVRTKPKVAVIMIGINNLTHQDKPADVARAILACVQSIRSQSPKTKVLLIGTLPTLDPLINQAVQDLNRSLQRNAAAFGAEFLNLAPKFKNSVGHIDASLFTASPHLSTRGYRRIVEPIADRIRGMLG